MAAWRLYRELENDWNKANAFANEHRKKFTGWPEIKATYKKNDIKKYDYKPGSPRPFRDAKPKREEQATGEMVTILPDLFCEDAEARKAKASVVKFLTEIMPEEFPSPASGAMLDAFEELERLAASS